MVALMTSRSSQQTSQGVWHSSPGMRSHEVIFLGSPRSMMARSFMKILYLPMAFPEKVTVSPGFAVLRRSAMSMGLAGASVSR